MDISEIRGLSDTDLERALVDAKQELWKIRFDLATRQEKNYSRLPATRKTDRSHPHRDDRTPARRHAAAADVEKAS